MVFQDLEKHGYIVEIFRVDSSDYGLPQGRVRLIFLGVHSEAPGIVPIVKADFFGSFGKDMKAMCHTCPDIYECILPSSDDAVQRELVSRSMKTAAEANPAHQNWPQTHMDFLSGQGTMI